MRILYVVGIGPGHPEGMTREADAALRAADVIVGYSKYVDLVRPYYGDKAFFATGMRRETERCAEAIRLAESGQTVALICSGDSGVYGMAGLLCEMCQGRDGVEVRVIPGVTAALSGGALLGAPLGHDFAVISLSDLLTPWETIEKRLRAAAAGDFCISIYNPGSHSRADALQRACDILLEILPPQTVCGLAERIGRQGESCRVLMLKELRNTPVDMFTTVFVGNSHTRVIGGKMVTPRGYRLD